MKKDWEIFITHVNLKKVRALLLLIFSSLILFVVLYATFYSVRAQQENRISEAVSLSPALIEKDVTPGESVSLNVKVNNIGQAERTLFISPADFVGDPKEGGSPQFVQNPTQDNFSSWIDLPVKQIQLKANERREIAFKINVPKNAEPGSHFGAIIVSEQNPANTPGNTVSLTSQVATLIFTKVAGEVVEKGKSLSFTTTKSWYEYPPVNFQIRFENEGNVRTKPTGLIEIYNSAGIKEEVIQINKSFGGVLPQTTRRFEETWNPGKWLNLIPRVGRYTAKGTLTYGLPSTTQDLGTITFWLIPYKALAVVAGVIIALIVGFLIFLRLYAKSVVSRSKRR